MKQGAAAVRKQTEIETRGPQFLMFKPPGSYRHSMAARLDPMSQ